MGHQLLPTRRRSKRNTALWGLSIALAAVIVFLAFSARNARRQNQALMLILRQDPQARILHSRQRDKQPPLRAWLISTFGNGLQNDVVEILSWDDTAKVDDVYLLAASRLPQLDRFECLNAAAVTEAGIASIAQARQLQRLTLNQLTVTDESLRSLENLTALTQLDLSNNPNLTNRALSQLRCIPNVQYLGLSGAGVDDEGLKFLEPAERLEGLNLSRTAITGAGLRYLRNCPLERVYLNETPLGDEALQELAQHPGLEELEISRTPVTFEGVACIRALKQLRRLTLGDGDRLGDEVIDVLCGLPELQMLSFDSSRATQAGLERLAALPNLRLLSLKNSTIDPEQLGKALPKCTVLNETKTQP
jgi:Leucine-rich repeat (LRR) protein